MRLQLQPNRWSCLPTSFAIVLGVSVEEIFKIIGHDGGEILWPKLPNPECRRGFMPNEMIYATKKLGKNVEFIPRVCESNCHKVEIPNEWFLDQLPLNTGVITGVTGRYKNHAVAWNGHLIIDPTDLSKYHYSLFQDIHEFWKIY
jgi:hypothetical protein